MRRSRTLPIALIVMGVGSSVALADLRVLSRNDTTNTGSGYRTWVTSSGGAVMSRYDVPIASGTSVWVSHGAGTALVRAEGLASTSYSSGGSNFENVFYVGTDGNLNRGTIVSGGAISWTSFGPPTGKTLSGNIAAGTFVAATVRYLVVGATTVDSKLYRLVIPIGGSATWTDSSAGLTWLNGDKLAATSNDTILSIFAAHTSGAEKLGMLRWNGTTWSTFDLSSPPTKRVCDMIAAAQGQLTTTNYRVVVGCTPQNNIGEFYVATSTSATSTTFTWTTHLIPNGEIPIAAAATLRENTLPLRAIDVYLLLLTGNKIRRLTITPTQTLQDLGVAPEIDIYSPGVAAVSAPTNSSRFFYVGKPNNVSGGSYLYERYAGDLSSNPQNYRALGNDTADRMFATGFFAEGKTSIWRGTTATHILNRPGIGATDWPRTYLMSSPNEGETLVSPQLITNVVSGTTYNYVSDPTSAVTDQRLMYAFQIGVARTVCSGSVSRASVYGVSTTNGTSFSAPIELEALNSSGTGTPLDHPYADVEHKVGAPDVIHVAWWVTGTPGTIHYAALTEGSTSATVVNLGVASGFSGGPPRVTANDAGRVIIYYGQSGLAHICEVNAARTGCTSQGWKTLSTDLRYSSPGSAPAVYGIGVSGSAVHMRTVYPVSMALSEASDTLYYCFHRLEPTNRISATDNDSREEVDAACTTATRDSFGNWSWDLTPVWLEATDDDHDQFAPEVVVTREDNAYLSAMQTAVITWYSRTDDPGNYLYKVKKTVSDNQLASVYTPRDVFNGFASDPEYLPRHCVNPDIRFIGDYAGSEGDVLHGRTFAVAVPFPGVIGTLLYSNFAALGRWSN